MKSSRINNKNYCFDSEGIILYFTINRTRKNIVGNDEIKNRNHSIFHMPKNCSV